MLKIFNFLYESMEEITKKVSWIPYEKLHEMTNLSILGIFIATLIIGIINISYSKLITKLLYSYFN